MLSPENKKKIIISKEKTQKLLEFTDMVLTIKKYVQRIVGSPRKNIYFISV